MPSLLSKILFLILNSFLLVLKSNPQIGLNGNPVTLRENESNASISEGDSILKFFLKESNSYFSYSFDTSIYTPLILRDSLFPKIKSYVESFLNTYHKEIKLDIDSSLASSVIPIFKKIVSLELIPQSQRGEKELKQISDTISVFPSSKEKVLLLINYLGLTIPPRTTYDQLFRIYSKATKEVEMITDLFEKGRAYLYIGDFFRDHNISFFPIQAYYAAQVFFYGCDEDSLIKYNFQGIVCEKIAKLFPSTNTEIITGIKKRSNYLITASDFFTHAKHMEKADQMFSQYISNYAYLSISALDDQDDHKLTEANVLHYLWERYVKGLKTDTNHIDNFGWYNIIGNILKSKGKYEEANSYFLRAMTLSIANSDFDNANVCFYNVSLIYALLNKRGLALSYSDAPLAIALKTNNPVEHTRALINKANIYFILKGYDTALIFLNAILGPYQISSKKDVPWKMEIGLLSFKLKIKIFEAIKSDSVRIYENEYNSLKENQLNEYIKLVLTETNQIAGWFSSIKTWEVSTQKYEKEKIETLNKKISNRNLWLFIGVGVLFISILGVAFFYRRSSKQSKAIRENLSQQIAFKNITTHDIKKLVNGIPLVLKRIERAETLSFPIKADIEHIKNVAGYVNTIFKMSSQEINTISEQIKLAEIYAETFKQTSLPTHYKIYINNKIRDEFILNKLPVPTLLLNNFIKNSIEHGFADKKHSDLYISINCSQTSRGFKITIEDNGCGINYAKSTGGTQGSGIAFAKETIDAYNAHVREFTIKFPSNSIFDKQDKKMGRGTIVIIELVKNKKWKLRS